MYFLKEVKKKLCSIFSAHEGKNKDKRMARKQCKTLQSKVGTCAMSEALCICSSIPNETGSLRFSLLQMLLLLLLILPLCYISYCPLFVCLCFTFHLFLDVGAVEYVHTIQHAHRIHTTDCVSFRFHEIHNRNCMRYCCWYFFVQRRFSCWNIIYAIEWSIQLLAAIFISLGDGAAAVPQFAIRYCKCFCHFIWIYRTHSSAQQFFLLASWSFCCSMNLYILSLVPNLFLAPAANSVLFFVRHILFLLLSSTYSHNHLLQIVLCVWDVYIFLGFKWVYVFAKVQQNCILVYDMNTHTQNY